MKTKNLFGILMLFLFTLTFISCEEYAGYVTNKRLSEK